MILNEHEVKTCLLFVLELILKKYNIDIQEAQLSIHDKIEVQAQIHLEDRLFDMIASFDISYKNHCLCFEKITGKVEYLFLSLNIMSVLQQLIHDQQVTFKNNELIYACELPIQELKIEDQHLKIILK